MLSHIFLTARFKFTATATLPLRQPYPKEQMPCSADFLAPSWESFIVLSFPVRKAGQTSR